MIRKVGLIIDRLTDSWIIEALAEKEYDVLLYDPYTEHLEQEKWEVEQDLDRKLAKWSITESEKKVILSHIKLEKDLNQLLDSDIIIESIKEHPEQKRAIIQKLDTLLPKETILAINSSILSISDFTVGMKHPERMIGVHFFHQVVEMIPGQATSTATFETTSALIKSLDKKGIYVQESPGFVTTRLRLQMMNEAITILSEGIATADDIDEAMKVGLGMNQGPLEMVDGFGLDYIYSLMEQLAQELGSDRFTPCPLLKVYMEAGYLGKVVGKGFFEYDQNKVKIQPSTQVGVK